MTNEGEVYFALYGDEFDPDDVTRIIGVAPTSVKRKGKPRPKHTTWKYSTGKVVSDVIDVYEMSSDLVSRLRPFEEKIAQVKYSLGLEAELRVVLWISTDETISTPAIGFDKQVISFLNTVGASIDVDTCLNSANKSIQWSLRSRSADHG